MSGEQMGEGRQEHGGIFIPYEKLFAQWNEKLDLVLSKLDAKLDARTFSDFQGHYEDRMAKVDERVRILERGQDEQLGIESFKRWLLPIGVTLLIAAGDIIARFTAG